MSDPVKYQGKTRDGRSFIVRSYRPDDRDRVRHICSETGCLGDPQEKIFVGRSPFADLFSRYYTDHEPETAFVAEVEGKVEGYIIGALDTNRQERVFAKKVLPLVVAKIALPNWWLNPINRKYVQAMRKSIKQGELKVPMRDIKLNFPAHLHTNIADPSLRGQGVGGAMMRVFLDHLRSKGLPGVHLGTTSHNRLAVPFYKKVGFQILAQNLITFYDHVIPDPPVHLLYMGKEL